MNALVLVAGALLTAACVGFVVRPLYAARRAPRAAWHRHRLRLELTERKEALYNALVEVDFDRDVGKLPEADHRRQRQRLEAQAMVVLAELESLDAGGEEAVLRARVERDVAAWRTRAPAAGGDGAALDPGRCAACGAAVQDHYRFCPACGHPRAGRPA